MNCPGCGGRLEPRSSQGITAYVCQPHGVWQNWDSVNELIRRSRAEEANAEDASLLEGFLWGKML